MLEARGKGIEFFIIVAIFVVAKIVGLVKEYAQRKQAQEQREAGGDTRAPLPQATAEEAREEAAEEEKEIYSASPEELRDFLRQIGVLKDQQKRPPAVVAAPPKPAAKPTPPPVVAIESSASPSTPPVDSAEMESIEDFWEKASLSPSQKAVVLSEILGQPRALRPFEMQYAEGGSRTRKDS